MPSPDARAPTPTIRLSVVGVVFSNGLRIAPRRVVAISVPLLPEARQLIHETWGAPIAHGYAMAVRVCSPGFVAMRFICPSTSSSSNPSTLTVNPWGRAWSRTGY